MFNKRKVGIMGTGVIAQTMAATIKKMKDVKCVAVASRSLEKAEKFAAAYGIKKAYGSYEELVKDAKVELIYIATPHSEHFANAKLCIEHNKAVLCEKAFTANAKQAEELLNLAQEKQVFITEAIWTRYMPFLADIKGIIASGIIGDICTLTCNLGYNIVENNRLMDPMLAGGALLDVGVYTLNFASMILGTDITGVKSNCTYCESGVDASNSIILTYTDGKMAVLNSTIMGISDRKGIVYGQRGYIIVENINNFESLAVYNAQHELVKTIKRPKQISGYEYEVQACFRAMDQGELECFEMPHAETIRIMNLMDDLRKEWGIEYPFEK